jgi:hypothetical protein
MHYTDSVSNNLIPLASGLPVMLFGELTPAVIFDGGAEVSSASVFFSPRLAMCLYA